MKSVGFFLCAIVITLLGFGCQQNPTPEQVWREGVKKTRESDLANSKKIIALLKEGGAYVAGTTSDGNGLHSVSATGGPKGDETTCSIAWRVPEDNMARIAEGMSLEEVRAILDLTVLHYVPNGPQGRFVLLCTHPNLNARFVFAGDPEVKLVSKTRNERE